jgi:hypothetical protein
MIALEKPGEFFKSLSCLPDYSFKETPTVA